MLHGIQQFLGDGSGTFGRRSRAARLQNALAAEELVVGIRRLSDEGSCRRLDRNRMHAARRFQETRSAQRKQYRSPATRDLHRASSSHQRWIADTGVKEAHAAGRMRDQRALGRTRQRPGAAH